MGSSIGNAYRSSLNKNKECLHPCNYLTITAIPMSMEMTKIRNGKIEFLFLQSVKKTTAYYVFGALTMVAEIGGIVGLFLGYSIYQITDIFDYCFSRWF